MEIAFYWFIINQLIIPNYQNVCQVCHTVSDTW